MSTPTVTAVILAYGAEPWLEEGVSAVLASTGVELDLVVVDNGCTSDAMASIRGLDRVRVITPSENLGYTGGCNLGAAEAKGDYIAFVNSDAIVAPDALAELVKVAAEPTVGMAMGSIRLAEQPELINSAGNPLHFVGLVWAGGNGEPAERYAERRSIICGSGCCFVVRRQLWEEFGGFPLEYFAYHEDTELSLRLWQRGMTVEYVPTAVVKHHYEFSRTPTKNYLLERNRIALLLTTYQGRSLFVLGPMLAVTEVAMLGAAIAGGWGKAKFRGYRWLWANRKWIRSRRRLIQRERTVPDKAIVQRMTATFDPSNIEAPPGIGAFNVLARGYWWAARRLV